MIRKLVVELDKQSKPLSNDEIEELEEKWEWTAEYAGIKDVIKDVEERHGIK